MTLSVRFNEAAARSCGKTFGVTIIAVLVSQASMRPQHQRCGKKTLYIPLTFTATRRELQ